MATKQQAYDHPAYITPYVFSGSTTAGANGISTKFAAFTAMQIKAVCVGPNIASTSASTPLLYALHGTATTTTTLTALTSGATAMIPNALATALTLAKGDQFYVAHGTDATVSMSVAFECYAVPGADLTA